jgi:cytochrome bd-type quinol oxidase subunit 2
MEEVLVYVWFFLLYSVLFLLVLLDGADLGIGVLALGVPQIIAVPVCLAAALAGFIMLLASAVKAKNAPLYAWASWSSSGRLWLSQRESSPTSSPFP